MPPSSPLTVAACAPAEWPEAVALMLKSLPPADRAAARDEVLSHLRTGRLPAAALRTARAGGRLVGAVATPVAPGATAHISPPQIDAATILPGDLIEDALLSDALTWLRGQGVKLGQALFPPGATDQARALLRHGFRHVTDLWYLRHALRHLPPAGDGLVMQPYAPALDGPFITTLLQTYEQTQDCPELEGVRTADEILAGHRGDHDPRGLHWWLARAGGRPVGVLLAHVVPEENGWDVDYVGVVPDARGRGWGRHLVVHALHAARRAGASHLALAVDRRNAPALGLYESLGFTPWDERALFLAVLL
jgi:ribosomal protein S18 acetylase RimI-like enzyme